MPPTVRSEQVQHPGGAEHGDHEGADEVAEELQAGQAWCGSLCRKDSATPTAAGKNCVRDHHPPRPAGGHFEHPRQGRDEESRAATFKSRLRAAVTTRLKSLAREEAEELDE